MTNGTKLTYTAPAVVDLGDINVITESINVVGGGDSIFSVLAGS